VSGTGTRASTDEAKERSGGRANKSKGLAREGLSESEFGGVETDSLDGILFTTVTPVADDAVPHFLHVDADLVLSAGFEPDVKKGAALAGVSHAVMRDGELGFAVWGWPAGAE